MKEILLTKKDMVFLVLLYFHDIINLKYFHSNLLKIDKKTI